MRFMGSKSWLGMLAVAIGMMFAACGGCGDENDNHQANNQADMGEGDVGELPEFSFTIDEAIEPFTTQLHGYEEGAAARPLSAVGGDDTPTAAFVRNELVIFSDDDDAVSDFVERIGGELILTENPDDAGVDAPPMHLVRVDAPALDDEQFVDDLRVLEERDEDGYELMGEFAFSDDEGANLIALAAREARENDLEIGVNWVAQPSAIPVSTEEEERSDNPGTYRDAYHFDWFDRDGGMRTGVLEAWNLLFYGNKLQNRVRIAILDMGFHVTDDLANVSSTTVWPGFGPLDRENDYGCSGGSPCPWHGTDVAGAAMGVPDNRFGSAGSAGPVGDALLVYTTYDYLASITAVYRARNRGAKIINMSYSADVPWWLKWTTAGFRHATSAVRDSGVLLFAAAGNDGTNVDREVCAFGHCWEKTFHTPCENGGVICVGGLSGWNTKDDSSNFGDESVDLWGPWCVDVGNNPDENEYHQSCGTSLASPFVAGVAALVWAANPALSASDVSHILHDTADGYRDEKVNAYDGVLAAIGSLMSVAIIDPVDGAERYVGIPTTVAVDTTVISVPGDDLDVHLTLMSSVDGMIGEQDIAVQRDEGDVHVERAFFNHDFSEGIHQLYVVAEAPQAMGLPTLTSQDQSTFVMSNPGPTVSIESPTAGEQFCSGQTVVFRAHAEDLNQSLPPDAYEWLTAVDADPYPLLFVLGNGPVLTTNVLPTAQQRVTVSVIDDGGQVSTDYVDIEVLSASNPICTDRPPQIVINEPSDGTLLMATGSDPNGYYVELMLQATAIDYEDDDSTLPITWSSDIDGEIATGANATGRIYLHDPCTTKHTITVRTVDSDGNEDEDSVEVSVYVVC